ncbi:MAG TPA: AAA family ATPase, partial [Vicinamibacteria bacterium]
MSIALPSPQPPLAGRDRELSILRARLAEAIAGQGSLVLIGGEAGVGKTALADTLAREAAAAGAGALAGRCYDLAETPPYGPWLEGFARAGAAGPAGTPPAPAPPRPAAAPSPEAFFAQAREFFAARAAARPLVVTLEDLHWADAASLDLLRFLARALGSMPLLLLATYRTDELDRRHPLHTLIPLLVREAPVARLELRPLDPAAARALLAARYQLPDGDAAGLATYLVERTEGNALFMMELLRTLEEEQLLRRDDGRWRAGTLDRAPVPLLLKQIVDGRVSRLGDEATALLAVAAVIGQEVPLAAWGAVTGAEEEALVALAERAEAAHLVTAWADGEGTSFTHALIREALYEGVPALRRRRLHRRVGEALAALPAPDPDAVAAHFQRAGDPRAVAWLIRAAERAE